VRWVYPPALGRPNWGSIDTALFGLRQTLMPLTHARLEGDQLRVPYERDHVKDAPNVDPDVQLTADEEQRLYRHYGMATAASDEQARGAGEPGAVAADASTPPGAVAASAGSETGREPGPASQADRSASRSPREGAAQDAMTRSEEEVRVGKRIRERGRARLKKYVVTDYVETKVPVKREEVRLEHEPPDEADPGG
jgi:hypothetical protein